MVSRDVNCIIYIGTMDIMVNLVSKADVRWQPRKTDPPKNLGYPPGLNRYSTI